VRDVVGDEFHFVRIQSWEDCLQEVRGALGVGRSQALPARVQPVQAVVDQSRVVGTGDRIELGSVNTGTFQTPPGRVLRLFPSREGNRLLAVLST